MATHQFSLTEQGFQPGSVEAQGGDNVSVTNNTTKSLVLSFPMCFTDTTEYTLPADETVTRTMKATESLTVGTYQIGASDPNVAGDEFPEGSTGDIYVVAGW